MLLYHLHLPNPVSYLYPSRLQAQLVSFHLRHKSLATSLGPTFTSFPPPTLLTFQTTPTYTCGRREIGKLSPSQIAYLRCNGEAKFHEALRGGQTTFHGPGQLTAYLIVSLDKHELNPRSYIRMLEDTVISTCAHYGLKSFTTDNPGVWTSDDDKIASVGVHLRRNVTSHGIGLNVTTDLKWFDRIVACGLVGKRATSLKEQVSSDWDLRDVASVFAVCIQRSLKGVEKIKEIKEGEIEILVAGLSVLEGV